MTIRCATVPLLLLGLFQLQSLAGVTPVSRTTSLIASGAITDDSFNLTDTFTEFGSYTNTIGQTLPVSGGPTRAQAHQSSNVDPAGLDASADGTVLAKVAEFDAIAAAAKSSFTYVFDVLDTAESVRLHGSLVTDSFSSSSKVTFSKDSEVLFSEELIVGAIDTRAFDEAFLLVPGRYTLALEALANGTPTTESSEFHATLESLVAIPIPLPPAIYGAVCLLGWIIRRHAQLC